MEIELHTTSPRHTPSEFVQWSINAITAEEYDPIIVGTYIS